jgi:hypothetical protein
MKKSTKAALYSALVFPGAGLLLLKHYWRAAIFMLPAALLLGYITHCLMFIADAITQQILSNRLTLDILNLAQNIPTLETLVQSIISEQHFHLELARTLLFFCWGFSIASSFFAGKRRDIELAKQIEH